MDPSQRITPRTLKGFRDYLPEAMIPRERLIDIARRVYRSYGFSPIDTPALEMQYSACVGAPYTALIDEMKTIAPLYLFGSYYYNLLAGTWVQAIFGAEYQTQCWSAGFALTGRNQSPNGLQKREVNFKFYVNLLNLGSVGGGKPYLMYF